MLEKMTLESVLNDMAQWVVVLQDYIYGGQISHHV
jgi:hypothetical protein